MNWVSLFNWIPLFFCIWVFKPYLDSSKSRKIILLLLLSGSFPLIISGTLQVFFDIHGPFNIFNGLIIWFQREGEPGLTGLFNNRNYASLWFTILWPICLAILSQRKIGSKFFTYIFSISIISSIYLTFSHMRFVNATCAIKIGKIPRMKDRLYKGLIWFLNNIQTADIGCLNDESKSK